MAHDKLKDDFFNQMDKELDRFIDKTTSRVKAEFVEEIDCPICSGTDYSVLFIKNGLDFVRCDTCSFVYVNPRFKEDKILEGYSDSEYAESNRIWKDILLDDTQHSFNNDAYTFLLDRLKEKKPNGGKLLDVGCSVGHFMEMAREYGYSTEGVELEPEARKEAEGKGFVVHNSLLEDLGFSNGEFDIVSLLGLIEHLPDPVNFMKEVNRILPSGGVVVFNGVPNMNSLIVMSLKEKARTFNGRNHLGYYTVDTLTHLLDIAGFNISYSGTYVTGLDSVINYAQFLDPFVDLDITYLGSVMKDKLNKDRDRIEKNIIDLGLGYKIRAIGVKR